MRFSSNFVISVHFGNFMVPRSSRFATHLLQSVSPHYDWFEIVAATSAMFWDFFALNYSLQGGRS